MDNAAKALEIAAGVLLGVMLFALVAYFFTSISGLPDEEDDILSAEQLALFNQEYEVYNKKQMYGVDVISCLNKVKSYDDKYVSGGAFMSGSAYGKKFVINVKVAIYKALEESVDLSVYKVDPTTKIGKIEEIMDEASTENTNLADKNRSRGYIFGSVFEIVGNSYTTLDPTKGLKKVASKTVTGTHSLTISPDGSKEFNDLININTLTYYDPLNDLLKLSGDYMKQTVINNDESTLDSFATAVWNTALYDFKKKMFKCDGVEYNSETGRIREIRFVEIK